MHLACQRRFVPQNPRYVREITEGHAEPWAEPVKGADLANRELLHGYPAVATDAASAAAPWRDGGKRWPLAANSGLRGMAPPTGIEPV